jgi:hypothetical protein
MGFTPEKVKVLSEYVRTIEAACIEIHSRLKHEENDMLAIAAQRDQGTQAAQQTTAALCSEEHSHSATS